MLYVICMQVWDKNSSGRISMAELSDMLENLGKKPTEVGIKILPIQFLKREEANKIVLLLDRFRRHLGRP